MLPVFAEFLGWIRIRVHDLQDFEMVCRSFPKEVKELMPIWGLHSFSEFGRYGANLISSVLRLRTIV